MDVAQMLYDGHMNRMSTKELELLIAEYTPSYEESLELAEQYPAPPDWYDEPG